MQQFQVNKFWRMALSVAVVMLGAGITYMLGLDWNTIVGPDKAGIVVMVIGVIKTVYESFAPGAGVPVVPTGSSTSLVTHKAIGYTRVGPAT